jgi:hypothetical protein
MVVGVLSSSFSPSSLSLRLQVGGSCPDVCCRARGLVVPEDEIEQGYADDIADRRVWLCIVIVLLSSSSSSSSLSWRLHVGGSCPDFWCGSKGLVVPEGKSDWGNPGDVADRRVLLWVIVGLLSSSSSPSSLPLLLQVGGWHGLWCLSKGLVAKEKESD